MPTDPWQDPEVKQWMRHVRRKLIPKISGSAVTISIVPNGQPDVKYAVELGMCIMLNKPILLFARTDTVIPERLRRVADEIIISDLDPDSRAEQEYVAQRVAEFMEKFGPQDGVS